MLKSDLINILVVKRGVTQKQAEATIETIFDSMKDALCRGENIEIRGLGAFHVKHYEGYQGRNPKTGEVIPVKPKRGILFRTGKELRDRVNRPDDAGPRGRARAGDSAGRRGRVAAHSVAGVAGRVRPGAALLLRGTERLRHLGRAPRSAPATRREIEIDLLFA